MSREHVLFALVALIGALVITRGLIAQPGYTDAFYHFNAANRLVSGQGLTDPYVWTYIGAPEPLPIPSHLYWMPLTSLVAAAGMWLLNAPGDYYAAQTPLTVMFALTICVGYWLGYRLGRTRRHAWVAGLLTLFSGFFTRFWGATDTFAPYALVGSLCLLFMGLGAQERETGRIWRACIGFALAGVMAALAHLTRADGLLLLIVGWLVVLWPRGPKAIQQRAVCVIALTLPYLAVMTPWFVRNLNAVGSPLPLGGAQAIWFTEYDDIFSSPPDANPQTFFSSGLRAVLGSRVTAASNNLGTFVAVEGLIAMTPLMLVGLWQRRHDGFLRGFWLYALGLHVVMTLVFPYPGYRGGLLHSAAALVPWWAALGVAGLDDVVEWAAQRRPRWRPATAKVVFSAGLVTLALILSLAIGLAGRVAAHAPELLRELARKLPPDARIMINDPARLYYFTGMGGVVLPNEEPEVILEIARRYRVGYLLLEEVSEDGRAGGAPSRLWPILTEPPDFLEPIPLDSPNARLYAIRYQRLP